MAIRRNRIIEEIKTRCSDIVKKKNAEVKIVYLREGKRDRLIEKMNLITILFHHELNAEINIQPCINYGGLFVSLQLLKNY